LAAREALLQAAEYGHENVVALLLDSLSDDVQSAAEEALIVAARHGHQQTVALLLDKLPDDDHSCAALRRALSAAVEARDGSVVTMLVEKLARAGKTVPSLDGLHAIAAGMDDRSLTRLLAVVYPIKAVRSAAAAPVRLSGAAIDEAPGVATPPADANASRQAQALPSAPIVRLEGDNDATAPSLAAERVQTGSAQDLRQASAENPSS
jgi:ankyrin repeat protein